MMRVVVAQCRCVGIFALSVLVLAAMGCASGGGPSTLETDAPLPPVQFEEAQASVVRDAPTAVAEALEASESAQALFQEGDVEGALANLDVAYALLLEIPDEPRYLQQKGDLRQLISKQLVDVYGSRLARASDLGAAIPVEINEHVQREIARFTGPERRFFLESYQRSGRFRPMIVRKLREAGMPEALSWLPLVESGFKVKALSSARALGMWQFISSTGTRYELDRTRWVDERMDPEKSTDAAIAYLGDLHGMFGDWLTALASYNCGENRVMRVIRRQETEYLDRFWDLYGELPRETARYVPRFLATLAIVADPEKYGMELPEPDAPLDLEVLTVDRHLRLKDLDNALSLDSGTLVGLNPELRHATTPAEPYEIRVPASVAPDFELTLAQLPAYEPPPELTFVRHRVGRGETLSTIARRYRSSVTQIVRANNLRSRHQIRAGQILKIPRRGASSGLAAVGSSGPASLTHTVRPGDTIGKIAAARRVPVDRLLRANGLSRSSTIYPGQVIRLSE